MKTKQRVHWLGELHGTRDPSKVKMENEVERRRLAEIRYCASLTTEHLEKNNPYKTKNTTKT